MNENQTLQMEVNNGQNNIQATEFKENSVKD